MNNALLKRIKALLKFLSDNLKKTLFSITLVAIVASLGGIYHIYETIWLYAKKYMLSNPPLWVIILLLFLLYAIHLIKHRTSKLPPLNNENLREVFGVYWNDQYKLRCLSCKHPLHPSSNRHDESIFFCSNCNHKFSLRDPNGKHINEAQAIESLKATNHKIQPTEKHGG